MRTDKALARLRDIVTGQAPELAPAAEAEAAPVAEAEAAPVAEAQATPLMDVEAALWWKLKRRPRRMLKQSKPGCGIKPG